MNNNEEYKLYNGDCLAVMDKLIAEGVKVDAIITDPPYGTTACKWDSVIPLDEMWKRLNKLIKDNGAICLFGNEPFTSKLICSNLNGFKYRWDWNKKSQAVWDMQNIDQCNKLKTYVYLLKMEKKQSIIHK